MRLRTGILIALFAVSLPALAEFTTVVRAVETSTSNMAMPTASTGKVSFRPCTDGCEEVIRVRLTAETSYVANDVAMDFSDFRREFSKLRRESRGYAFISYDTRKNTVTSVKIGDGE